MFCQSLTSLSFPISMNILLMIFTKNIEEKDEKNSIIEKYYGDTLKSTYYYFISGLIPLILIIILIFDYFKICGRICKKRQKNQSFYLKNEIREKNISNGRYYLMKLNNDNIGSLNIIV